ncbi:hypothetical protein PCASD_25275 [Puccinia coronata f. sp. avenae]|uniref:Restriction of telomere capping protein 4 n=1 Tax=Puccinia coronata f. sp. avenae TaxID=200324 RepID=A0A2N5RYY8_9BASI|nr:hypothetical protein PCASD_25275 [Puccinia coronata f. sp. avenae]
MSTHSHALPPGLRFKKNNHRIATPIAVPTVNTRPPSFRTIDLTGIEHSSTLPGPAGKPTRFGSASAPFKPPRTVNPRSNPPKQSLPRQTNYGRPSDPDKQLEPPPRPQTKLKPNRVSKPKTPPNGKFENRPLPEIFPPSSRHPSVSKPKHIGSGFINNSSTNSRAPQTNTNSSRSTTTKNCPSTSRCLSDVWKPKPPPNGTVKNLPLAESFFPFSRHLSVSKPKRTGSGSTSNSSTSSRALQTNTKSSRSTATKDYPSTSSCLSDLHLSTRSPSSDGASIVPTTQNTCQPLVNLKEDIQNTLSGLGMSLQTDRVRRPLTYNHHISDPDELSLEITQSMENPECLCPFCDELLPEKPSSKLTNQLKYLKTKPGVEKRKESKNPFALYLPFPDIATFCQLHRAEKNLIPMGIKKGWPKKIDFQSLPQRIRSHRQYLHRVCTRDIASDFMEVAVKAWTEQGRRKVQSVANELATFQIEQPGYYGVRGYEVIYRTLHTMFLRPSLVDTVTKLAHPLSPDFLLRKVLVPEAALCLIAEDLKLKVTDPHVRSTLEDSRTFGTIMFPDPDDETQSSSDDPSTSGSDAEGSSPRPFFASKAPKLTQKRPRKSESCELDEKPDEDELPTLSFASKTSNPTKKRPRRSKSREIEESDEDELPRPFFASKTPKPTKKRPRKPESCENDKKSDKDELPSLSFASKAPDPTKKRSRKPESCEIDKKSDEDQLPGLFLASKAPNPTKNRPRKSESCEIEIMPHKKPSQKSGRVYTSSDQENSIEQIKSKSKANQESSIEQIKSKSKANLKVQPKRYGAGISRHKHSAETLKDGWKRTMD